MPDGDIGDLVDDDIVGDELDDGDVADPTAQTVSRSGRRLRNNIDTWKTRATAAEAELATLRAEAASLETRVGSVAQLRTSLLQSAIRSQAAPLVAAEALEDTVRLLNTSGIVVADDGKIDLAKVRARIEDFVKARPHLAPRVGAGRTPQLPGGHMPSPNGHVGHEEINDQLRRSLRGGGG